MSDTKDIRALCETLLATLSAAETHLKVIAAQELTFDQVLGIYHGSLDLSQELLREVGTPTPDGLGFGDFMAPEDDTDELLHVAMLGDMGPSDENTDERARRLGAQESVARFVQDEGNAPSIPLDDGPEGSDDVGAPEYTDETSSEAAPVAIAASDDEDTGPGPEDAQPGEYALSSEEAPTSVVTSTELSELAERLAEDEDDTPLVDTGEPEDDTPLVDTGELEDETPLVDTGELEDDTPLVDTGEPEDETLLVDTGEPEDETLLVDTGEPEDETLLVDTGEPEDETLLVDTGEPEDETLLVDTGEPEDETPLVDTGEPEAPAAAVAAVAAAGPFTADSFDLIGGSEEAPTEEPAPEEEEDVGDEDTEEEEITLDGPSVEEVLERRRRASIERTPAGVSVGGTPAVKVAGTPQVKAGGAAVAVGAKPKRKDAAAKFYAASQSVPKIMDGSGPKPKAAALQLNTDDSGSATSGTVVGFEEEDEPIEIGGAVYEDEDEWDGDEGFSMELDDEDDEEWEYEDEDEEEEEAPEPEPELPPEPEGPTEAEIEEMLAKARRAMNQGNLEAGVDLYSDVLDADPDNAEAHIGRGRLYLDLGDYARAMSDFTVAEELAPESPEPHVATGDLYFARKDYRKAIEYFDAALEAAPEHAMAFCRRGISHYYRKNYKQALNDLNTAVKLDPDIPNIRTFVSMAKKKAKKK